jgi:hypothetical protein
LDWRNILCLLHLERNGGSIRKMYLVVLHETRILGRLRWTRRFVANSWRRSFTDLDRRERGNFVAILILDHGPLPLLERKILLPQDHLQAFLHDRLLYRYRRSVDVPTG